MNMDFICLCGQSARLHELRELVLHAKLALNTRPMPTGCIEWTGELDHNGYGRLGFGRRGEGNKTEGAHRVSYSIWNGKIPAKMHVRHTCDNPRCVNPKHLLVGTHDDNMRDMARRERSHLTRLTAPDVIAIRRRSGEDHKSLAAEFGVTKSNISMIVTQRTWRHLPSVSDLAEAEKEYAA